MSGLFCVSFVFLLLTLNSAEKVHVQVDESPVRASLGRSLRLSCAIPGYGIIVHPMFARWERRHTNSGEFHTITSGTTVVAGLEGISISLLPGDYTSWYPVTIKSFRPEDTGIYRCVVSGPSASRDLASATVHVIT